jgi:hypothetical protein
MSRQSHDGRIRREADASRATRVNLSRKIGRMESADARFWS